ncbi:branched-chain amino acid ABC transporter substrate-binding protein [Pseudonocardia cypriaca]|uniref:Branched-chain amino acid transport system substrate-binding protein n=1 Tax=Pseudonocardia cypriaca TaxID=882449 RepID=A0A543FS55_9PSEU|nr:branched-chain amino acid ABC transporter substrate-binding protein [Pseudonocardia cypriaca]TQM36632.1 branched-chain amino acid transport system substrate-binding protein [Pseudonocardia cypriaca]
MSRRYAVAATGVVLVAAALLSACGTNRSEGDAAGGSSCDTSKGTLVIGMIAPMSGGVSAFGLGMRNSADLAIDQANENCTVPGYRLVFQPEDDQSLPQIAAQAATKLASDPNVAAVVGTYNSSTAQSAAPILAQRSIVQVSPANTGPALTRGEKAATQPRRPFPTYFRVAANDLVQGPFGARYLVQEAGKKKIAVIDDGKTYGVGLVENFVKEAERLGARIVAREKVGEKDTDFSSTIAAIRSSRPDAVYYGGEYPAAGPLSRQLAEAGLDVPLMGGDGIADPQYIELGGRPGDFATNIGAPVESLSSARAFVDAYAAAGYPEPSSAYGPMTFDATNVIIGALAGLVRNSPFEESSRQRLVEAVQRTNLPGASGTVAFDEFGDTTNKVLTVSTVKDGEFEPLETGVFEQSN